MGRMELRKREGRGMEVEERRGEERGMYVEDEEEVESR